jgi:hypothetical protein
MRIPVYESETVEPTPIRGPRAPMDGPNPLAELTGGIANFAEQARQYFAQEVAEEN